MLILSQFVPLFEAVGLPPTKKMQKCPAEELNLAHLLPQGAVISSDCVEFRAFSDNMSEI